MESLSSIEIISHGRRSESGRTFLLCLRVWAIRVASLSGFTSQTLKPQIGAAAGRQRREKTMELNEKKREYKELMSLVGIVECENINKWHLASML
jgi:hypothetical protein